MDCSVVQLIKKSEAINRFLRIDSKCIPDSLNHQNEKPISNFWVFLILLIAKVIVHFSIESYIGKIILLSIIGLIVSNYIKKWVFDFALKFGSFFILIIMAVLGLKLNFAWVPIASMANVGGIATAPAVTAAYEKKWMPHAIVLAILSMASGTFWGILTMELFRHFFL